MTNRSADLESSPAMFVAVHVYFPVCFRSARVKPVYCGLFRSIKFAGSFLFIFKYYGSAESWNKVIKFRFFRKYYFRILFSFYSEATYSFIKKNQFKIPSFCINSVLEYVVCWNDTVSPSLSWTLSPSLNQSHRTRTFSVQTQSK